MASFQDFSDAAIVAAHPDDEVLWFGSLVPKVGRIVLCYGPNPAKPERARQRLDVVNAYPYETVRFLALTEPPRAHAPHPGQHAKAPAEADSQRELATRLREALVGVKRVFAHNPWGEYGHPDHRRVHAALEALAPELGYRLYGSCYVERRALARHGEGLAQGVDEVISVPVNAATLEPIVNLYKQNSCWTWDAAWSWPEQEHFLHFGMDTRLRHTPAPLPLLLFDSGW